MSEAEAPFSPQAKSRLSGKRPEDSFKFQPMPDQSKYGALYPTVAVQLPMFNETAVCQAAIDHSCQMHWPRDKFMVQVGGRAAAPEPGVGRIRSRPSRCPAGP